jgi:hypothetical protein
MEIATIYVKVAAWCILEVHLNVHLESRRQRAQQLDSNAQPNQSGHRAVWDCRCETNSEEDQWNIKQRFSVYSNLWCLPTDLCVMHLHVHM